jgi:hypothetical protein
VLRRVTKAEAEHEEGTMDSSRSYDGVLPGGDNLPVATSGKSFPLACAALSSPLHCHPFFTAEMSKRSATRLEARRTSSLHPATSSTAKKRGGSEPLPQQLPFPTSRVRLRSLREDSSDLLRKGRAMMMMTMVPSRHSSTRAWAYHLILKAMVMYPVTIPTSKTGISTMPSRDYLTLTTK